MVAVAERYRAPRWQRACVEALHREARSRPSEGLTADEAVLVCARTTGLHHPGFAEPAIRLAQRVGRLIGVDRHEFVGGELVVGRRYHATGAP